MKRWWPTMCAMAVVLVGLPTAWAQEPSVSVDIKTADGIRYYSGGVGTDERAAMPKEFRLKLMFATQKGHYLSGVQVRVSVQGKSLATLAADQGPWLFVDLKPGNYKIRATYRDVTQTRHITVAPKGTTTAYFHWPVTRTMMGE